MDEAIVMESFLNHIVRAADASGERVYWNEIGFGQQWHIVYEWMRGKTPEAQAYILGYLNDGTDEVESFYDAAALASTQ